MRTNHLNRRVVLLGATALTAAACAGVTMDHAVSQASDDISLIATGLAGALPALGKTFGIKPATVAQVGDIVVKIQTVAVAAKASTTVADVRPLVKQLETLVNGIVTALAGLNLPSPFGPALAAASVLLPVVEIAVGFVLPPGAGAPANDNVVATARLTLRAAGAR